MHSILTFDLGNIYSGVSFGVIKDNKLMIKHIWCVKNFSDTDFHNILQDIKEDVIVFYEVSYYRNHVLKKMNFRLMKLAKERGLTVKGLSPSQKYKYSRKKEANTRITLSEVLPEFGSHLVEEFTQHQRNHDISDAILMLMYIYKKGLANIQNVRQLP